MKKTVYIAIEIKVREFISKIFLAHYLVNKNYRVILGSKDQIFKHIKEKNKKGGVFFYKAGVHKNFINILNNKVDVHATIDQEMAPGLSNKAYAKLIPNSFHQETAKDIDLYYCLNKQIYKIAKKTLGKYIDNILFTGWPRFEIYQKKFKKLFQKEVNKIKNKYGNFILFNSDFLFVSKYYKQQALHYIPWGLENKRKEIKKHKKFILNHAKLNYQEFLKTVDFLKKSSDKIKYKIIIRPHPGESLKVWRDNFKDTKNVLIAPAIDDVHPWIVASKGLLHRGCTTSFQSLLIRKPTAYIEAVQTKDKKKFYKDSWKYKKIPYTFSTKISSFSSFENWIKTLNKLPQNKIKILKKELGLNKITSCKLIFNSFEKFVISKENRPRLSKNDENILKYFYYKYKHSIAVIIFKFLTKIGILQKNIAKFDMVSKIPNGITALETNYYLKLMDKIQKRKSDSPTKATNLRQDLIIIDRV